MKPRLIDIARRADVSEATVSRVLNARPGVNEATRSAVLEAARALGRELPAAVAVREALVGVLVPDVENPVFAQWAERIEAELFQRGAAMLLAMRARSLEREREILERFARIGAQGIIVVSGHHAQERADVSHYRDLSALGVQLALINGVREDIDAAFVSTDDARAVDVAVAHLRELGHERIGLAMGDERTWPVREKVHAFERLARGGTALPVAYTDFTYAGGYQAALELVGRGCTAILCGSDVMAAGALEGVRGLGLEVPRDVSVVGYDDSQWAAQTTPPLTSVRQSVPQMARAAVRAVLEGGEGSRRPRRTEVVMTPELVVRGSTAAAPAAAGADAGLPGASSGESEGPGAADTMTG